MQQVCMVSYWVSFGSMLVLAFGRPSLFYAIDFYESETGQLIVIRIKKLYNSYSDFCSIRNLKNKMERWYLPFSFGFFKNILNQLHVFSEGHFYMDHFFLIDIKSIKRRSRRRKFLVDDANLYDDKEENIYDDDDDDDDDDNDDDDDDVDYDDEDEYEEVEEEEVAYHHRNDIMTCIMSLISFVSSTSLHITAFRWS
ncbi:hypothetical protein RhiirA4_427597 [Rhizophagus irregularis]|uniref:Uncharacterized protein n=1 Tax=Rhizophagus irregularis TaxID=588596 RepID=A0A2I1H9K3_9GLOM|nr:hypothetical protein RhiirA4_427597 [Rhizophagus irregularis]